MNLRTIALSLALVLVPAAAMADGGVSGTLNEVTTAAQGPFDRVTHVVKEYIVCVPSAAEAFVDNMTEIPNQFKDAVDEHGWLTGIFTGGVGVVTDTLMNGLKAGTDVVSCGFDEGCPAE